MKNCHQIQIQMYVSENILHARSWHSSGDTSIFPLRYRSKGYPLIHPSYECKTFIILQVKEMIHVYLYPITSVDITKKNKTKINLCIALYLAVFRKGTYPMAFKAKSLRLEQVVIICCPNMGRVCLPQANSRWYSGRKSISRASFTNRD